MKRLALLLLVALFPLQSLMAQTDDADYICGTYRVESPVSDDVVKIKLFRASDGTYRGKFVWLSQPNNPDGTPRTDVKNPDPEKRNRTADQIVAVWGLKYSDGQWVEGKIYDPTTGKTYGIQGKKAKNGKDLQMRYYLGKPAIGLTSIWTRVEK